MFIEYIQIRYINKYINLDTLKRYLFPFSCKWILNILDYVIERIDNHWKKVIRIRYYYHINWTQTWYAINLIRLDVLSFCRLLS